LDFDRQRRELRILKKHTVLLSLLALCVMLAVVPAMAQQEIYYDNGPVNGQTNALLINFGSAVSNSFEADGLATISGLTFWVWLFPGDSLNSIEVSIGSAPFGSNEYDNSFNLGGDSNCFINHFGYNVCQVSIEFNGGFLSGGNFWLTLKNAEVPSGNPVYWDQNAGVGCLSQGCPSRALQKPSQPPTSSAVIPSETFTMYGVMISGQTDRTN
jgi:hypothetical protein